MTYIFVKKKLRKHNNINAGSHIYTRDRTVKIYKRVLRDTY